MVLSKIFIYIVYTMADTKEERYSITNMCRKLK